MNLMSPRSLLGVLGVAGVGWTAYSAFGVPHDVGLPRPVPGEAGHIDSLTAGRVAVYQMGPDTGREPVVLVHGFHAAASAYDLRPLYTALAARGRRVVALDMPGFGHSDRSPRAYNQSLMVAALRDVLEQVVAGPAHVVALSAGSEVAAKVALERPDLVSSLTLISPTGLGSGTGGPGAVGKVLAVPVIGQAFFDALTSRPSIRYFLSKNFLGPVDDGYAAYAWMSAHQPGARHAPRAFLEGALFDSRIRSVYERVSQPSLVIYGDDPNASQERLPELATRSRWQAHRISSAGLPHYDNPVETGDVVERFIEAAERVGSVMA
jgi:pimeloyl-ACP methyl ester carboxylesterase